MEEQRGENEPGTYRERTRNVPGTYQDCIMLPGVPFCVCFSAQIGVSDFDDDISVQALSFYWMCPRLRYYPLLVMSVKCEL